MRQIQIQNGGFDIFDHIKIHYTHNTYTHTHACTHLRRQIQISDGNFDIFDPVVYNQEKTLLDIFEIDHPDVEARRVIMNFLVDRARVNEMRVVGTYDEADGNIGVSATKVGNYVVCVCVCVW